MSNGTPPLAPGARITLHRPGGAGNVILAADEPALDDLIAAQSAGRLADFVRMREAGQVFVAINGTVAEVLEVKPGRVRVRIAGGYRTGANLWVEAGFVRQE